MRRALLIALVAGAPAAAAPFVALPPGAVATHDETRAPGGWAVPLRPYGAPDGFAQRMEGNLRVAAWRLPDGDSLAPLRRIEAALAPEGWRPTLFCEAAACGGFDFRAGLAALPLPAMRIDLRDFHVMTLRRGDDWLSLVASRTGGAVHLQAVRIEDARAVPPPTVEADPSATVAARPTAEVAAPAAPSADPPATAAPAVADPVAALLAALDRHGHAALEGVAFAPGAETLDPGADPVLDAAAAALAARPDLRVAVIGHTDGDGPLAPNLRVSAARARLVRDALVARGVDPARLEAEGAGWLAPRASNADPAGRARNRRVELVAR